jgi:hypothetical protein
MQSLVKCLDGDDREAAEDCLRLRKVTSSHGTVSVND